MYTSSMTNAPSWLAELEHLMKTKLPWFGVFTRNFFFFFVKITQMWHSLYSICRKGSNPQQKCHVSFSEFSTYFDKNVHTLKIFNLDKHFLSWKKGSTGFQSFPSMEAGFFTPRNLMTLCYIQLLEAAHVLGAAQLLTPCSPVP